MASLPSPHRRGSSSSETLVSHPAAASSSSSSPPLKAMASAKADGPVTAESGQITANGRPLMSHGSAGDTTQPIKKKSTSKYALERPEEVTADEEDRLNQVKWDPDDPENPQNWSVRYRMLLTAICSLVTMNVTFASSAPSSAVQVFEQLYTIDQTQANLITALFLLGYVFGPLFWAPGSELVGRRPIFAVTLLIYALFTLADAVAQNPTTLFVCRFLAGFFAAAPLTNCGGVIADIWTSVGRGPGMAFFSASVFIGPAIGPIVGGFVVDQASWRIIFYVMFGFAMFCWLLMLLLVPETYSPILLKKKAERLRKEDPQKNAGKWAPSERLDTSFGGILHLTLIKPFTILALEPILQVVTLYLSVVYAILYCDFESFPIAWQELRGFNGGQTGLIFIGVLIGAVIGALIAIWQWRDYRALNEKWSGTPPPEYRLKGGMVAGPCLCVALFWFGWTGAYPSVPWYVPALATIPLGVSFCLVFISFLAYIVDCYVMHAASALAANTICRSALAASFPLFTPQMFHNMGFQWAATLLGCISLLLAPSPFLFYKYGPAIRRRSRFAPNWDLAKRDEVLANEKQEKGDIEGR